MAVYVDDANIAAAVRNENRTHSSTWCHLSADSEEELHQFAASLGLKRAWFQNAGKPTFHYDLTAGKRAQAVALGATEVTWGQLGELVHQWRCPDTGYAHHRGDTLAEQTTTRLAAAGYHRGDPALAQLREHNATTTARAFAPATDREPGQ